ncbi:MAG: phosphate acyltransferase PlsX [Candidatus Puniceispirillum sp.]|nr:phosphate acyltransferase PlsX [Candidatus Puniceispirillum sp.]
MLSIAIDVMGGDHGPREILKGIELALQKKTFKPVLFGKSDIINQYLKEFPKTSQCCEIVHCDSIVDAHTKPSIAFRYGRSSNLGKAIQSVADGITQAVISSGNTGAYMALCKSILKTLPGISRPAIPAIIPTCGESGKILVLDLGANIECTPTHLVQFAAMANILVKHLWNIENPTVGILNVGTEEMKGNIVVQETFKLLKEMKDINTHGFVEGSDILYETTNIVVTDGFTGNIALKAIEGTAQFIGQTIKAEFSRTLLDKLRYLFARKTFNRIKSKIDPRIYNGALFLGLNHLAVKSHGSADAFSFSHAIYSTITMIERDLTPKIAKSLENIYIP